MVSWWHYLSAVVFLTASCSSEAPPDGETSGIDGPVIFSRSLEFGEQALIEGAVQLEDGCFFIDAGARSQLMWPNGTSWDGESESVVLPDGTRVRAGDIISGGGGDHPVSRLDAFTDNQLVIDQLRSCGGTVSVLQGTPTLIESG